MFSLYKRRGETPLQALDRLRIENPELKKAVLSYAGRLDPMAEGLLLVLVGEEENKRRAEYLELEKEYEVEVLFGVETDSYDVLGKVISFHDLTPALSSLERGEFDQSYPPYSSQPVNGKPLWWWAREGKLSEITIPTKKVTIFDIKKISERNISAEALLKQVLSDISLVQGDFRQDEIGKSWESFIKSHTAEQFQVMTLKISCSSGTYMRSFAHQLGGIALKIVRTKIGDFKLESYPH